MELQELINGVEILIGACSLYVAVLIFDKIIKIFTGN